MAHNDGPVSAEAAVSRAGLTAHYTIAIGSPLTFADIDDAKSTIAAGLVHPAGAQVLHAAHAGGWGYLAVGDSATGNALFFRTNDVTAPFTDDGRTAYVAFRDPTHVDYAFAAWTKDSGDFKAWLAATLDGLAHPASVHVAGAAKRR